MLLGCMLAGGMVIQQNKQLKDGLYLVDKVVYNKGSVTLNANQMLVHFNHDFAENVDSAKGLIINTADFVPLLLQEEPLLLNKKKLELTFSRQAAEKLERFTEKNVMKQVTMVVNGEAITVKEIREAIHGGKMEVTSSNDNACQRIYVTLKNRNIQKN